MAGGVPYVFLILAGALFRDRTVILILAIAATFLTMMGFFLSPAGSIEWVVFFNRSYAIIAIWTVAIVLMRYPLMQENRRFLFENKWNHNGKEPYFKREIIFATILSMVIGFTSWGAFSHLESDYKVDIGKSLTTALESSHVGIRNRLNAHKRFAHVWTNNAQIQELTRDLLKSPREKKTLINNPAQSKLQYKISPLLGSSNYRGFFIIDKNNINISSSRHTDIGTTTLLETQEGFLEKIWAGETLVTLPMASDVPLIDNQGNMTRGLATMFVATPITNKDGESIAILTFRLDSDESFNSIFKRGRLGVSGETYAFNRDGLLLSESRFNDQLKKIGLLPPDKNHSDLYVMVRDPQINLTTGGKSILSPNKQPLTKMAQSATSGESQLNLDEYNDYRGVPVVGAWLWDEELGFGIATEIDINEAFDTLTDIRITLIAFTAISICTIYILAYVFRSGRKEISDIARRFGKSQAYANIGTWELNIEKGEVLWSETIAPMFGFHQPKREITTKELSTIFHPDDLGKIKEANRSCLEDGTEYNVEHRIIWEDGSVHWVLERGDVERNEDGTPICMLGVVIDIDERKKIDASLAIQAKELNFQKFALDEHAIVSTADVNGKITSANNKFCEASGYSLQEVIGQNHRLIKSNEHSRRYYKDMWETISRGNVWQGEVKNRSKTGEDYWVTATIVPFMDSHSKPFQYIYICTDITKRKEAEIVAMAANRAKSDLMANMSHELRTPLNAIIGFSCLIKQEMFGALGNNKYKDYIEDIHNSGEHLLELINDILDVSAIEADALEIHEEHIDMLEIVNSSVRLIKPKADSENITITHSVTNDIPIVYADKRRVKQIFLNLLSNATKFTTGNGHVTIDANLKDTGSLEISVTDTGIGMNEDEVRIALSNFGQVDSGLDRRHEGTGLGLPLAKRLIELHGGTLQVTSERGEGTKVTMVFPKERLQEHSGTILAFEPDRAMAETQ